MRPSYGSFQTPIIQRGVITNVDVKNFTVDVFCKSSGQHLKGCPITSDYAHYAAGEGVTYMPEVGASCWVCTSSQPEEFSFVLGFCMIPDKSGSFRGNRPDLNPGDYRIGGRDGNEIIMRRGGILEVGAGQMPRRIYIPTLNTIRDFSTNYEMNLVGGDWKWEVKRAETSPVAFAEVLSTRKVRRFSSDKLATVEIKEGSVDSTVAIETSVYTVLGMDQRTLQVQLKMGVDGNVTWEVEDSWRLKALIDVELEAEFGDVSLVAPYGKVKADAMTINLNSTIDTLIKAGVSLTLQVGSNTFKITPEGGVFSGAQPLYAGEKEKTCPLVRLDGLVAWILTQVPVLVPPTPAQLLAMTTTKLLAE